MPELTDTMYVWAGYAPFATLPDTPLRLRDAPVERPLRPPPPKRWLMDTLKIRWRAGHYKADGAIRRGVTPLLDTPASRCQLVIRYAIEMAI